jgi:motility quorum-sensing regulator/GCU-specific mRNA interferase toxin
MEKRRPTYDLSAFQAACSSSDGFELTMAARRGAHELALGPDDVVAVLLSMRWNHFYKSMTSYDDHTVWQDVYHVRWGNLKIYVKFTAGRVLEFRLLSFKER